MRRPLLNPKTRRQVLEAAARIWGDPEKRKAVPGRTALQYQTSSTGAYQIAEPAPSFKTERERAQHRK
jgi:hypothetical protein